MILSGEPDLNSSSFLELLTEQSKTKQNGPRNQRDQGFSPHSQKKRCKICQDHEKERQHSQVQGSMQSILVHVESERQRKGRQVEAVSSTRTRRQGHRKVIEMICVLEHATCTL